MLPAAEVCVWWAHVDDLTQAHLDLLDESERERWARFRRVEDRRRFALGSVVLRSLVAELDGTSPAEVTLDRTCPTCGAQHGPVTIQGRPWLSSVSHSGSYAVAALVADDAARHLGIDLETRHPPDWRDLLGRVVAVDEPTPTTAQEFLTLWVRKEAVLKATREGLSRPMTTVRLSETPLRIVDLDVRALDAPGYLAAALAVDRDDLRVRWERARI